MPDSSDATLSRPVRRIAILSPSLAGQGAERKALYIGAGLLERGHEVDLILQRLVCHYPEEVPEGMRIFFATERSDERTRSVLGRVSAIPQPLVPDPVPWRVRYPRAGLAGRLSREQWPLLASTRLPRWAASIAEYMDRERPHAVLAMNALSTTAAAMALRLTLHRARFVATLHQPLRRRLLSRARRSYPCADAAVGVSLGVTSEFAKIPGMDTARIRTVYNPIGSEYIARKASEPVAHRWLDGSDCPVILAIGKLIERKGYSTLLRAFARVASQRPARLIVLGEGRLRTKLLSLASRLGVAERVDFPGFSENPFGFLARADLFVLSSQNEGLPTVLVEAMICGCPVVSTDCRHGPREILEDGRYGPLVPVDDPEALASAMVSVLDKPPRRKTLQDRAAFYSVARAVDRYEELLLGREGTEVERA